MTDAPIRIRPAVPTDLDVIVAFNQAQAMESEHKHLDPAVLTPGVRRAIEDQNRCLYFVAEVGGQLAGQTMVTREWSDWRNGFFWWIQSVYVDPAYRRRGVFRALHQHVRDLARRDADVCGIRLYVRRDNERAIQTYGKLDMAPTEYLVCEEDWSNT